MMWFRLIWIIYVRKWEVFDTGELSDNLCKVSHDALVVLGAYGPELIKEMLFGNTMEKVQTILPNNLLIVGPKDQASMWSASYKN